MFNTAHCVSILQIAETSADFDSVRELQAQAAHTTRSVSQLGTRLHEDRAKSERATSALRTELEGKVASAAQTSHAAVATEAGARTSMQMELERRMHGAAETAQSIASSAREAMRAELDGKLQARLSPFRVPLCAARTLNITCQPRVTLSLQ